MFFLPFLPPPSPPPLLKHMDSKHRCPLSPLLFIVEMRWASSFIPLSPFLNQMMTRYVASALIRPTQYSREEQFISLLPPPPLFSVHWVGDAQLMFLQPFSVSILPSPPLNAGQTRRPRTPPFLRQRKFIRTDETGDTSVFFLPRPMPMKLSFNNSQGPLPFPFPPPSPLRR